jgi:hypothetical protein
MVEHLPSKIKALNSTPNTTKKTCQMQDWRYNSRVQCLTSTLDVLD